MWRDSEGVSSSDASDAELLRAVGGGNEAALRELFDRHAPWLALRLRARLHDPEAVADVLQDTFVAVWRSAGSFRGDGEVGAWVWGIAVHRLLSRLRARPSPSPMEAADLRAALPLVDSAEDELLVEVEFGEVGAALRSLSPELREVVRATVIDGLSTREAARLLGLPHGTVKSRLRIAKAQLRDRLMPLRTELVW